MPADREIAMRFGARGLNLRDDPNSLHAEELADSINWQITRQGGIEKRLGFAPFGAGALPAAALEYAVFAPSGGTTYLVAYCANGNVYRTTDGTTWTSIVSGLSVSARPTFVQYLDKLYWSNGVDQLRSWDGTTVVAIASAPLGRYLAIWRNRLWTASPDANRRAVYWSGLGDPADWTNVAFNVITFPDWPMVTGITPAQNPGDGADAADGLLVFTSRSMHRIVDDSDNATGVVVGGANVLVDRGQGCVSQRTIGHHRGRVYVLGQDGVYSTDGRAPLRLESAAIGPVFTEQLDYAQAASHVGFTAFGRYYLAFRPTGAGGNTRLLELYLDLSPSEGQYPWMAHDVPLAAAALWPGLSRERVYFADASSGDTGRARQLFSGGSDTDGASTAVAISARARTGGHTFGVTAPKKLRRLRTIGWGTPTIGVSADGAGGVGEAKTFLMEQDATDIWTTSDLWGQGTWGAGIAAKQGIAYFEAARGRHLTFEITEASTKVQSASRALGLGSVVAGAAAVSVAEATVVPLDC